MVLYLFDFLVEEHIDTERADASSALIRRRSVLD
jgi:hypothetical protein